MTVLSLLERLGCLPEEDIAVVASATGRWRRSFQRGLEPCEELALFSSVDGDTAALWRHAEAARTPERRSAALCTAAAYLANVPVVLPTDSRASGRVIRTCLALALAWRNGGPPADESTARRIAQEVARSDTWAHVIPLLPSFAPGALRRMGPIARDIGRREPGVTL